MSDSVQPHRWQPTRLPRPWDSPGKNTGVGCHFLLQCMKVKSEREVAQSCLTLCDPMDCSLPCSSVHGTFQARVLEWIAIAFSRLTHYHSLNAQTFAGAAGPFRPSQWMMEQTHPSGEETLGKRTEKKQQLGQQPPQSSVLVVPLWAQGWSGCSIYCPDTGLPDIGTLSLALGST